MRKMGTREDRNEKMKLKKKKQSIQRKEYDKGRKKKIHKRSNVANKYWRKEYWNLPTSMAWLLMCGQSEQRVGVTRGNCRCYISDGGPLGKHTSSATGAVINEVSCDTGSLRADRGQSQPNYLLSYLPAFSKHLFRHQTCRESQCHVSLLYWVTTPGS